MRNQENSGKRYQKKRPLQAVMAEEEMIVVIMVEKGGESHPRYRKKIRRVEILGEEEEATKGRSFIKRSKKI